jgi:GAF domain-containing protein
MEAVVRTAAGVFDAAASSIAFVDETTLELVYQSAWGAGASEIVGVRLPPGTGIAGSVAQTGESQAVPNCRTDPRFAARIAAGTGYVPYTMLCVPLLRHNDVIGVLSLLDRRDGNVYGPGDLEKAQLFAELAVTALNVNPSLFTSMGMTVTSFGRPRDGS